MIVLRSRHSRAGASRQTLRDQIVGDLRHPRPVDQLLDLWGLEEGAARVFVQNRLADFTIHCLSQPLQAPTHASDSLHRAYIASVKPGYPAKPVFDPFAARARNEGWSYYELPTGHDAQAEMPEALTDVLLEIAAQQQ